MDKRLLEHYGWSSAFLLLFIVAFYIQNRYAISNIDDWPYSFICERTGEGYLSVADDGASPRPITSLRDAIASQSVDYFKSNGRFITHTLVQYFCGTMPMSRFICLNTLVFALFTLCLLRLTVPKPAKLQSVITVCSAIWLLIPFKGLTMMGNIALSMNYLWAAAFNLLFILLYLHTPKQRFLILAPLAFIIGSLQESFSISIAAALIVHAFFQRKTIRPSQVAIIAAYNIGMLTCVLSPANFQRAESIGGFGFHIGSIFGLLSSPIVWLFIVCIAVTAWKGTLQEYFRRHTIVLMSIFFNLVFVIFVAYNGRHQLTAVNIFMFVFVFKVYFAEVRCRKLTRSVAIILNGAALLSYFPILQARQNYHAAFQKLTNNIMTTNNSVVDGHDFEALSAQYSQNLFLNYNYIATFTFLEWDFYERTLSLKLSHGRNPLLVTTVLPDKQTFIASSCDEKHALLPHLYSISHDALSYYVYTSTQRMPLDSVTLKVLVRSKYFVLPDKETEVHPNDVFRYDSLYYYLFRLPSAKDRPLISHGNPSVTSTAVLRNSATAPPVQP